MSLLDKIARQLREPTCRCPNGSIVTRDDNMCVRCRVLDFQAVHDELLGELDELREARGFRNLRVVMR